MNELVDVTPISADGNPPVRGFLHQPADVSGTGLLLSHGAGGDCQSASLVALAGAFAGHGIAVLRCDLPFRQLRPHGPPPPGSAEVDRAGLRRAVRLLHDMGHGTVYLGGRSYGARQASILATEEPELCQGLLLISYPLHPPRKRTQLRTAHFPRLRTDVLFVHGSRDPYGSLEELEPALALIPGRKHLLAMPGRGHELPRTSDDVAEVVTAFATFFRWRSRPIS